MEKSKHCHSRCPSNCDKGPSCNKRNVEFTNNYEAGPSSSNNKKSRSGCETFDTELLTCTECKEPRACRSESDDGLPSLEALMNMSSKELAGLCSCSPICNCKICTCKLFSSKCSCSKGKKKKKLPGAKGCTCSKGKKRLETVTLFKKS